MTDVALTSEADAVKQAAGWADALLARVHRGPGDNIEAAMHRAEQTFGVPVATFWSLRYRPPKMMAVAAWHYLKSVYEAECARQEAKLRHELEITKALAPTRARLALVAETEALLGPSVREEAASVALPASKGGEE